MREDADSTDPEQDVQKQGTEEVIREVVGEESKEYSFALGESGFQKPQKGCETLRWRKVYNRGGFLSCTQEHTYHSVECLRGDKERIHSPASLSQ